MTTMNNDTTTPAGHGQLKRHLRKYNHCTNQMMRAHSGTYQQKYCDRRRFNKWNNARKKLDAAWMRGRTHEDFDQP